MVTIDTEINRSSLSFKETEVGISPEGTRLTWFTPFEFTLSTLAN
jgi:hypothetical protein